jgi:hypothetical protein
LILIPDNSTIARKISLQRIVATNRYASSYRSGMDLQTTLRPFDQVHQAAHPPGTPTSLFADQKAPITAN